MGLLAVRSLLGSQQPKHVLRRRACVCSKGLAQNHTHNTQHTTHNTHPHSDHTHTCHNPQVLYAAAGSAPVSPRLPSCRLAAGRLPPHQAASAAPGCGWVCGGQGGVPGGEPCAADGEGQVSAAAVSHCFGLQADLLKACSPDPSSPSNPKPQPHSGTGASTTQQAAPTTCPQAAHPPKPLAPPTPSPRPAPPPQPPWPQPPHWLPRRRRTVSRSVR